MKKGLENAPLFYFPASVEPLDIPRQLDSHTCPVYCLPAVPGLVEGLGTSDLISSLHWKRCSNDHLQLSAGMLYEVLCLAALELGPWANRPTGPVVLFGS